MLDKTEADRIEEQLRIDLLRMQIIHKQLRLKRKLAKRKGKT